MHNSVVDAWPCPMTQLPIWLTSAQTLAPRPVGEPRFRLFSAPDLAYQCTDIGTPPYRRAPLPTFQRIPKAGTLPIGAMSHACPAASCRALSAPALLCTHMVYGPEYCYECEMWLHGGRQYWEHLHSRLHEKRSRRHRGHRRSSSCPPGVSTYERFSAGRRR